MKPEPWHGDRQRKTVHAGAKLAGVPFGNAGDEVGGARQRQGAGKAAHDRHDFPFQPQGLQGFVDRSRFETKSETAMI